MRRHLATLCVAAALTGCLIDKVTWTPLEERGCDVDTCAYVKASNTGAADRLGEAIALSRDGMTLAVGAPREDSAATGIDGDGADDGAMDAGAVYVYRRSEGAWTLHAYIKPSRTSTGDRFGSSVALSGDGSILAVGAPLEGADAGAVHVFRFDGTSMKWSEDPPPKVSSPMISGGDQLGQSVALSADGSTLAVGAHLKDDVFNNAGAVYVFVRNGTMWDQQAYLRAPNPGLGDQFGSSVALSENGSTLAVGALSEDGSAAGVHPPTMLPDNDGAPDAGAVYLFTRTSTIPPTWPLQAYVKASNTGAGDQFGFSVALSGRGSTLAVGAVLEASAAVGAGGDQAAQADDTAPEAGAVYVFIGAGTSWRQDAYIKASNTGVKDQFGHGVALSTDGSILVVGALGEGSSARGIAGDPFNEDAPGAGAVYRLVRTGTDWNHQDYLKSANTDAADFFGSCVALSGDGSTVAAGAPGEASATTGVDGDHVDDSAQDAGAAYVFHF